MMVKAKSKPVKKTKKTKAKPKTTKTKSPKKSPLKQKAKKPNYDNLFERLLDLEAKIETLKK